jgi:adenylate kinase
MNAHDENNRAAWLEGPSAKCFVVPEQIGPAWRLVLLGAPGVGKGTQAALLSRNLGVCHLSTGDVFRAAQNRSESDQTPAMAEAMEFMRQGHLVPDETVWELVRERAGCLCCQGGFVLDGFPRTLAQAESLEHLLEAKQLPLHAVLNYELPVAEIVSRLSGRRTCAKCKSIFNVSAQPPRKEGICGRCGGPLFQREDDRPEAIAVRFEAYERSTAPLIEFYQRLGLLTTAAAVGTPEEIFRRALAGLEARRNDGTPNRQLRN